MLVSAFLTTFVLRLSGLREIVEHLGRLSGTRNFSSLSPALARPVSLAYVQALVERLQCRHRPAHDALVVVDAMPVTLPATQRHRCARYNNRTVGGGVIWSYMVHAVRGVCPVRVLKVVSGAWNDARQMRGVALEANGPVHVMDRGFYALELLRDWIDQGVRFIVRARRNAVYETLRTLSAPRPYGTRGWIEVDALVRLGSAKAKAHPITRLIRATVGKQIIVLVTGETNPTAWSAERVLDAYKKRERIEQFHRFVKDIVGLAHLYSFSQSGITFLLYTALLLAMLLALGDPASGEEVIRILRRALRALRKSLGLGNPWRRNTNAIKRHKLRENL